MAGFGFAPDDAGNPLNTDTPTCRLCFEDAPAKWLTTSNLLSHIKKHHLEEYVKVRASNKRVSDC